VHLNHQEQEGGRMTVRRTAALAVLSSILTLPISASAQDETTRRSQHEQAEHDRAVREQNAHDRQHHTGAKIIGGSAAGGAVIGGLAGGGKGALIGGAAGAGGGAIANKVRKDKAVKKREQENREYRKKNPPQ
jgi:outer membrane lipoprotein SlyB